MKLVGGIGMSQKSPRGEEEMSFSEERIAAYAAIAGKEELEELFQLGESVRSIKVQQINSVRVGGGVAEMLRSLVPFQRKLGLDESWEVISGTPEFFFYTKTLHNFLQGKPEVPDLVGTKIYWDTNRNNSGLIRRDADIVFIHDPQPAGLIKFASTEELQRQNWIWRCHIHLSHEYHFVLDFMRTLIEDYDLAIFSTGKFLPPWDVATTIMLPYIDPLSEKTGSFHSNRCVRYAGNTGWRTWRRNLLLRWSRGSIRLRGRSMPLRHSN